MTLFVGQSRYQLDPISDVLAKTNQALGTLETYRQRLEQVLTRLTALEFQGAVMLDDVLVVVQRAEMTTRMAEEIERNCVELGEEGRLIRMQLEELMADVPDEKAALVYDYHADGGAERTREGARGARRAAVRPAARVRAARAARLPGARSTRSTTASRRAATASCRTSRAFPTRSSGASSRLRGLDAIVRATQRELEAVDGVGAVRAREIREGLRRLQEHNLVDRYLQL